MVVATEFGRTAAPNGNKGTDHGTAGATLLYGGSVSGANAAELLHTADVDGALVGGASLTAAAFVPIIAAA